MPRIQRFVKHNANRFRRIAVELATGRGKPPEFTRTQELFIQWNAERLGISVEEGRKRYRAS